LSVHKVMILRNHGLLACGESVAEAFDLMYYLERACQSQINAMSGGTKLRVPPTGVPAYDRIRSTSASSSSRWTSSPSPIGRCGAG